ncbi:MAG: ATPase, T2SS/T4P/T4SS family [Actinomycetota bacterium]
MTATAYDLLRSTLADRVKELDLDRDADEDRIADLVENELRAFQARANVGLHELPPLADPTLMYERLVGSLLGHGLLDRLLADPDIEEIFIDGGDVYHLGADGRLRSVDEVVSEAELFTLVNRLLQDTGRELNQRTPMVQARVLGGTARLGVVAPPIADSLSVTLRKYRVRHETLEQLVELESMTPSVATLVRAAMRSGLGVLVCGRPGAGKTTMLNACLRAVPLAHRVLCCEEIRELSAPLGHGAYYQTRPPSTDDGAAEVTLRDIVKMCLGMRPDLLVVGEVRGAEAFELLRAGNAGCGVLATVHANSAPEALVALADTAIMAGQNVPAPNVRSTLSQIFDLVVFVDRDESVQGGPIRRCVMQVATANPVSTESADFDVVPVLERSAIGEPLTLTSDAARAKPPLRLERALADLGTSWGTILDDHRSSQPVATVSPMTGVAR